MNWDTRIDSISSACLMRTETRTELMDGSMRHCSSLFRDTRSGFSSASSDNLASTSG